MPKRGRHLVFVAAAAICAAGWLASVIVTGAAGERCKGRRCESHTTTAKTKHRTHTTTSRTTTARTTTATSGASATATTSGATSAASAQVVFNGGFETGSYKPWTAAQSANYGKADTAQVHFGTFNPDTQNVGQGKYSGRFSLPAYSGGKTRSQVFVTRPVNAGGDDYYSLMFYVPSGWSPGTNSFWGVQLAEVNFENLGPGAGVSLQAHADHVTLNFSSGQATSATPYFQYRSNADAGGHPNLPALYAIPRPMKTGVWHELVLHAHWATNSSGVVEVWHRLKGQSAWTKTVSLSGVPTLQWTGNGSYPGTTLDILQAYRGGSSAPTTVWLDAFARTTSFAAAAANMP